MALAPSGSSLTNRRRHARYPTSSRPWHLPLRLLRPPQWPTYPPDAKRTRPRQATLAEGDLVLSKVYWHSPSGTAELSGSERAWLRHLALGPAHAAWDLTTNYRNFERAAFIMSFLQPEDNRGLDGEHYLFSSYRKAAAQNKANYDAIHADWRSAVTDYSDIDSFLQSLALAIQGSYQDLVFSVNGHKVNACDINLNTALMVGSEQIQLAAKIHGWCEAHCWVDGPDRGWLAQIMRDGLEQGVYRAGLWYVSRALENMERAEDASDRRWVEQGWETVIAHLESRDDEPIVMSYSVCDQFPNPDIAGIYPAFAYEPDYSYDACTKKQYAEIDASEDAWDKLPEERQWALALDGLKEQRPWAQITPQNLGTVSFGPNVTIYDLLAPDRLVRFDQKFAPVGLLATKGQP